MFGSKFNLIFFLEFENILNWNILISTLPILIYLDLDEKNVYNEILNQIGATNVFCFFF